MNLHWKEWKECGDGANRLQSDEGAGRCVGCRQTDQPGLARFRLYPYDGWWSVKPGMEVPPQRFPRSLLTSAPPYCYPSLSSTGNRADTSHNIPVMDGNVCGKKTEHLLGFSPEASGTAPLTALSTENSKKYNSSLQGLVLQTSPVVGSSKGGAVAGARWDSARAFLREAAPSCEAAVGWGVSTEAGGRGRAGRGSPMWRQGVGGWMGAERA